MGSIPAGGANKKPLLSTKTREVFLSDAFLWNEMRTLCVMQASPVIQNCVLAGWVITLAIPDSTAEACTEFDVGYRSN